MVAALQINGRAPWAAVAAAAGSTETTVARRAGRLLDSGELRIVGMVDPIRCGFGRTVLCQLRCEPGSSEAVATHLAELPQARFVTTVTGAYDAIVELVVTSRADLARLLLEEVQATPGIRDVVTAVVTRKFKASYDWARGLLGERAGHIPAPEVSDENLGQPVTLDQVDLEVIAALRENGRATSAEIASVVGLTEATAHRRVNRLIKSGCVVCGALVAPESMGFEAEVFWWLRVNAAELDRVVQVLRTRPEVRYLAATAGFADLACELMLPGYDDLFTFANEVLHTLPGVHADASVELRTIKRGFLPAAAVPTPLPLETIGRPHDGSAVQRL